MYSQQLNVFSSNIFSKILFFSKYMMIENDETNSSADDFDFEKINIQEFLNSESESSDADIDEETVTNTHIVSEK